MEKQANEAVPQKMHKSNEVDQQRNHESTPKYYAKRVGTAILGHFYETKLLAMAVFRKLIDDQTESFYLGSNIADIGVLDDIVVRSSVGGKTRKQFAQVKHKSPEYTVNFDDLVKPENTKNDFHLFKFFESYLNIRNKFSTASADVLFKGEFDNVDLIVFTPAMFIFPDDACCNETNSRDTFFTSGKIVKIKCTETILEILTTESKKWHMNDEKLQPTSEEHISLVKDFLSKLRIYSEQAATEKELEELTNRDLIGKAYSYESLLFKTYDFVTNWCNISGEKPYLTEQCKVFKEVSNELKLEKVNSKSLSKVGSNRLIFQKTKFKNQKLSEIVQQLKQNKPCLLNIIKPLFSIVLHLLEIESKAVDNIYRNANKLIVVTKKELKDICTSVTDESINILDLEHHSQDMVLETPVLFQGFPVSLRVLLGNASKELINGEVLQKLSKGETLAIGKSSSVNEPIEYYVDRKLYDINQKPMNLNTFIETHERVVIITAEPGMGKSTLLTKIAFAIKKSDPSNWIVRINMLEYSSQFRCWKNENRTLNKDDALNLLTKIYQTSQTETFEKENFDWYCQQSKIMMLVDGFDEISSDYTELVLQLLILCINNFTTQLWITTRAGGVQQQDLEDNAGTSITLKPFSVEQCKYYLRTYWAGKKDEKFKEYIGNVISFLLSTPNQVKLDLLSIPLHLNMFAQIFQSHFEQSCISEARNMQIEHLDLIALYEKFIDLKYTILMKEKHKICKNIDSFKCRPEFWQQHKRLAIAALFSQADHSIIFDKEDIDAVETFLQDAHNLEGNIGLIKPLFTHQTFAAFFAAQFIWGKYASLSNKDAKPFIDKIFIECFIQTEREQTAKFLHSTAQIKNTPKMTNKASMLLDRLLENLPTSRREFCRKSFAYILGIVEQSLILENKCIFGLETIINDKSDECLTLLLLKASEYGYQWLVRMVTDLRSHRNISFNWLNDWTPLHFAAREGFTDIVSLLLSRGANTNRDTLVDGETALHIAARNGHLEVVQLLLKYGADFNKRTKTDGSTPLHYAALNNNPGIIQLLVAKGANIDCTTTIEGRTPLFDASLNGAIDAVKILLEMGANVHLGRTNDAYTPLHCAALKNCPEIIRLLIAKGANIDCTTSDDGRTPLYQASIFGSIDAVKILLEMDANVHLGSTNDAYTPLHCAAGKNYSEIIQLLVAKGANIDCTTSDEGRTPLYQASIFGSIDAVKILLEMGANVHLGRSDNAWTPLHIAAQNNNPEIIQLLISKGANVDCTSSDDGRTPLFEACKDNAVDAAKILLNFGANVDLGTTDKGYTPLHLAAQKNCPEIIRFLVENGANVDCTTSDEGRTPLFEACRIDAKQAVQILLNFGANVHLGTTDKGYTPLHLAAQKNCPEIIRFLVENGANVDCTTSDEGRTPLYQASINGSVDAVKILLEMGANVHLGRSDNAWTPLHIAAQNNNPEIIQLLISKGANVDCTTSDDGRTPLFEACKDNAVDAAKILLNFGANVDLGTTDKGYTPLHLAAQKNCPEIIRFLVENGANIDCTTSDDGRTPLFEACRIDAKESVKMLLDLGANIHLDTFANATSPLHVAAYNDSPEVIRLLVDHGANACCTTTADGRSPLYEACRIGALNAVKILLDMGANVNLGTVDKGVTPLHCAAEANHPEIIQLLVDHEADINRICLDHGRTPLYQACLNGATEVVKMLLDMGANVNLGDTENGLTPLHWAAQKDQPEIIQLLVARGADINCTTADNGRTPLFEACRNSALNSVEMLLMLGANVNIGSKGNDLTPLHLAAQQNCTEILELLVDHGANVNCTTVFDGRTPLLEACQISAVDAVKMLLASGANVHSSAFDTGATALHFAACNDSSEIIKLLVDCGADINCTTKGDGRTPLYEACRNDASNAVKMLLALGANTDAPQCSTDSGYPPLHMAAQNNSPAMIKLLIEYGADIDCITWDDGRTALYEAFQHDAMDAVRTLLELGARVSLHGKGRAKIQDEKYTNYFLKALEASGIPAIVNHFRGKGEQRESGYEPESSQSAFGTLMRNIQLMCAIEKGNALEVERLLKSGAEVNFVDHHHNRKTPLHAAVAIGNTKILTLLLESGANADAKNGDNLKPIDFSTFLDYENKQEIHATFEEHFKKNESAKSLSEPNYLKRPGSAAVGQFYETKLLTMVLFRLLHDDQIEDFYLANNLDEAGAFDDVVLRTTAGGKSRMYCLQAKHAKRDRNNFDLKKYWESYLHIRNMFSPNSDNLMFRDHFEQTELELIVFTPAALGCMKENFTQTSSSGTIFHTHGAGRKVKIKCSQSLLESLVDASRQWHRAKVAQILAKLILIQKYDAGDVKKSIERMQKDNILREFNTDQTTTFDYTCLLRLYSNFQDMAVSSRHMKGMCQEIAEILEEPLIPSHDEHVSAVQDFFNKLKFYSEQATEDVLGEIIRQDIKTIMYERDDIIYFKAHNAVENWWKQSGHVPYLTKRCLIFENAVNETRLENIHSISLLRVRYNLFKFRRNEKIKPKWVKLHEEISSREQFFMNISSDTPELSSVKFMQYFQMIAVDFKFVIIDPLDVDSTLKVLSKVQPNCLILAYLPQFDPNVIEKVRLTVKKGIAITSQPYRGDWRTIEDETNSLLAFESFSQDMLLESVVTFQGSPIPLAVLLNKAPRRLIDAVTLRKLVEGERLVVSNTHFLADRQVFLEYYFDRTLTDNWSDSKSITEIRDRVVILAAEPGMGKSTLLTALALEMKKSNPSSWIVRLNLIDYGRQLRAWSETSKALNKDDAFKLLLEATTSGENGEIEPFERDIFNWYCEQFNINLLIYGFDEISPDYTSTVLNLLTIYRKNFTAKLWVTTRFGEAQRKLEETFNMHSYRLEPLTRSDAEVFIQKNCKFALTPDHRVMIEKFNEFIGVPLHLKMMTNILQDHYEMNRNLTSFEPPNLITLYEQFIAITFETMNLDNIQLFQYKHKLLAIVALFNHTEVETLLTFSETDAAEAFQQEIKSIDPKLELITKIIDHRPIFIHQMYAEYFAANFIWEKFTSLQNNDFDKLVKSILIDSLVKNGRIQIIKFFKQISKKSFQSYSNLVVKINILLSELIDKSPAKFHQYNKQAFDAMLGIVENGLNVDSNLRKTLQPLVQSKPVSKRNMLLLRAFECGYVELARAISGDEQLVETLQEMSSNGRAQLGYTPLHWAAEKNLAEIAALLLRDGASINRATKPGGCTPLHVAVAHGYTRFVQLLLDRGANLNLKTVDGKTALHVAVEHNNREIAAKLVKKGAILSSADGRPTPLHLAELRGHTEMAQLLRDLQPRGYYEKKFSSFD